MKKWLENLLDLGLVPYISTSGDGINQLDLSIFGGHEIVRLLEDPDHRDFHEAYLVSNALGFGNLKMPNWVYIDCVLMQTAVVGFAIATQNAPVSLQKRYSAESSVDFENLDYIPVSGQIAAASLDGRSLIGFSLFSLRKYLEGVDIPRLGHLTKLAALSVYRAEDKKKFIGISQYDNAALGTHALFGKKTRIEQAMMPLHSLTDMSFIYSMKVDLNEERVLSGMRDKNAAPEADFLLKSDDRAQKQDIQNRIHKGEKFYIVDPVHIRKEDGLYLPVCVEKA